jgi:hypothetical protein
MSRFFYHMGRLLQFLKPGQRLRCGFRHLPHLHAPAAGNAVTSAEIEVMRRKNKELVQKLRELDAQHEKQDEANQLRERFGARARKFVQNVCRG